MLISNFVRPPSEIQGSLVTSYWELLKSLKPGNGELIMLKQIKLRKMLALPTLILAKMNPEHEEGKQGIIQKCNQSPVSMAPNILSITVYSCTSSNTLCKGISISGFRYTLYNQGWLYQALSFLLFLPFFLTLALPMYIQIPTELIVHAQVAQWDI